MDISSTSNLFLDNNAFHKNRFLFPPKHVLDFIKYYAAAATWVKTKSMPEFVIILN